MSDCHSHSHLVNAPHAVATIALAGNPNAGKSTIFNALTGGRQHVANYPGKTVEKKAGTLRLHDQEISVVDLPGTYSLSAFSVEEVVARDFIVKDHPNVVISVVDAANLERNLYLVVQLLEMGAPLIVALNMVDIAEARDIQIDCQELSAKLGGVPIVRMIGNREVGLQELKTAIHHITEPRLFENTPLNFQFDPVIEAEIDKLQTRLASLLPDYPSRWAAIKLLEADEDLLEQCDPALLATVEAAVRQITTTLGEEPEILIADARYGYIGHVVQGTVVRPLEDVITLSDKIDQVLTHRYLGVPIFLGLMWLVFQFTANVSAPYLDWMDGVVTGPFTHWIQAILGSLGLGGSWLDALLTEGIIAGVGGVLVFIPVLCSLYFAIALLEDSGYMARAAFVMDRFMNMLGLHGKSFLPMLIGFGCTVPAIFATRTLENKTDRKITAFLTTFMSCGARLPVYVVFGSAFFGASSGNLVFAMYLTGIGVAIATSLVLTRIMYRNKPVPPFVMELPPYRVPSMKSVLIHMWERSSAFIRKAGTVILMMSVLIWLLMAIPAGLGKGAFNEVAPEDSVFGTVSKTVAPVLAPAGFGDWEASGALVTGLVAKEVVVSSMSQVYVGEAITDEHESTTLVEDVDFIITGFGEAAVLTIQEILNIVPRTINLVPRVSMQEVDLLSQPEDAEDTTALEAALKQNFSPRSAVAFNIFILLYVPCMSATAAMRSEFGTRWMLMQVGYTLGVAWLAAVLVYQVGGLL